MYTPIFPAWRSRLARVGRQRARHRRQSAVEIEEQFARFISRETLAPPGRGPGSRRRKFFLSRVFWAFVWQVLHPRTACRAVVRQLQAFGEDSEEPIASSTSAYCQARKRLPLACFQLAMEQSAQAAERLAIEGVPGWKRRVRVIDGTCIRLPDSAKNRQRYPYAGCQRTGCGFPTMKLLTLMSLESGAIVAAVQGAWRTSEVRLLLELLPQLRAGDILLGDRAYGSFFILAHLPILGVDVVSRLNQMRILVPQRTTRLAPDQWLLTIDRPRKCPPYLTPEQWLALPEKITVRIIRSRLTRPGFRTTEVWLSTTLLDHQAYPAERIVELYLRRWEMELCLRDIKTTMGMEELRCLTPEMIDKELRAFLTAHNFVRCAIAEAAAEHRANRTRISFKGTVDTLRSFHQAMRAARSARKVRRLRARILEVIASDLVPLRPERAEPRAVKRRPKPYQRLTKPRRLFRENPHRGKIRSAPPCLS